MARQVADLHVPAARAGVVLASVEVAEGPHLCGGVEAQPFLWHTDAPHRSPVNLLLGLAGMDCQLNALPEGGEDEEDALRLADGPLRVHAGRIEVAGVTVKVSGRTRTVGIPGSNAHFRIPGSRIEAYVSAFSSAFSSTVPGHVRFRRLRVD